MEDANNNMTLLNVKKLTKHFGGLAAVSEVDFYVRRGEILGMIGPNGAGKTSIFNLITGFYACDEGEIIFEGEDIRRLRPDQICKKGITRTFQIVRPFVGITVFRNVLVGALNRARNMDEAKMMSAEVIEFTGLDERKKQIAANLSTPERKRLELAKALATQPKLILLDEVAAGLNPRETEEVIMLIREINKRGITILVIEHVMKAIMSLSDRVIVLNHGKMIATGTPLEISKNQQVIKAYLGKEYRFA